MEGCKDEMHLFVKHFSELSSLELYKILSLRSEVFVVEQDCVYQDPDNRDQDAWHVWIEDGRGDVVACLRVFWFDEGHSQIGRVANSMKVRGTGVGKCIMLKGIEVAKEHFPDIPILIHAQQYASGFYEKCGFEVSSEPFDEDGIPHVEMLLYHK